MSPREGTPLIPERKHLDVGQESFAEPDATSSKKFYVWAAISAVLLAAALSVGIMKALKSTPSTDQKGMEAVGPYQLVERQEGQEFFEYYDFLDGPDSQGSAGYNVYVGEKRATELGIMNVTSDADGNDYIYMSSAATEEGPRESIRLEGKRRFDRGLFILDLKHMPAGCGVWPAFWLTDEDAWPNNGEIDIVEGINNQTQAKTALHTSDQCSMYAHVPSK